MDKASKRKGTIMKSIKTLFKEHITVLWVLKCKAGNSILHELCCSPMTPIGQIKLMPTKPGCSECSPPLRLSVCEVCCKGNWSLVEWEAVLVWQPLT